MQNKIGIIGTKSYSNSLKINTLFNTIKRNFGNFAIIQSGGNTTGVEWMAKKLALELNMTYKEYNPSYTGWNMYSALDQEYYGKKFHTSHLVDRYKKLIYNTDHLFIFIEGGKTDQFDLNHIIKLLQASKFKCNYRIVV